MARRAQGGDSLPSIDRVPPHNLEAEQATLGAMLMEKDAILAVLAILTDDGSDYYSPQHQTLHRVMLDVFREGKPVDLVTLPAVLADRGQLEMVGGKPYLVALQGAAPTAAAAVHYAGIVKEKSTARQQIAACGELQTALFTNEGVEKRRTYLAELLLGIDPSAKFAMEMIPASELVTIPDTVEWVVDKLVPFGGVTVLAGKPGSGKSWLGLELCHAITTGGRWMGHYPTLKHGGALYVDADCPRKSIAADRYRKLLTSLEGGQEKDYGEVQWLRRPGVLAGQAIYKLAPYIQQARARFIVIDSLRKVKGRTDLNDEAQATACIAPWTEFTERMKVSLFVIHHERKLQQFMPRGGVDDLAGSYSLGAEVDSILLLTGGEETKLLTVAKARSEAVERPSYVRFKRLAGGGLLIKREGEVGDAEADKREEAKGAILEVLTPQPVQSPREVISQVSRLVACSRRTILNAADELIDEGKIRAEGATSDRKWIRTV